MKHLKKYNESIDEFKGTDDEILDYFMEYYDDNNIEIKNGYITKDRVIEPTNYFKGGISKYKKVKIVKIGLNAGEGLYMSGKKSLNNITIVRDILDDLERFYDMTSTDINYTIYTDYNGIIIEFIVNLGDASSDDDKTETINDLFKELQLIYKKKKYRPVVKGNWFELRLSGKKKYSLYGDYSIELLNLWNKIKAGEEVHQKYSDLVDWYNKLEDKGLDIKTSGGDHQFILKLIKR